MENKFELIEDSIDKLSLENRDLDIRLSKLENEDLNNRLTKLEENK